jgi:hypothetical protein
MMVNCFNANAGTISILLHVWALTYLEQAKGLAAPGWAVLCLPPPWQVCYLFTPRPQGSAGV